MYILNLLWIDSSLHFLRIHDQDVISENGEYGLLCYDSVVCWLYFGVEDIESTSFRNVSKRDLKTCWENCLQTMFNA